jgi:hypothetical protein
MFSVFLFLGFHFADLYHIIGLTPLRIDALYAVVNAKTAYMKLLKIENIRKYKNYPNS